MPVKSRDLLLEEINTAVRSNGVNGKTTAADLRILLGSLVDELIARTEPDAEGVFYRGINLNGEPVSIAGHAWQGETAGDGVLQITNELGRLYVPDGLLQPAADAETGQMLTSFIYGSDLRLTIPGVPPGTYDVYVYVWEDNAPTTFTLAVNGEIQTAYSSGAMGTWARLGPFQTSVAGGQIELHAQGGDANLSGVELWKVADAAAGALPPELLAALAGSLGTPSPENRFVTQLDFEPFKLNRANVLRANGNRDYFQTHGAALTAAQSGDTVVLPAPIVDAYAVGNFEQINVVKGVSVFTQGFPIGNATTNGDAITLRGGRGKIIGGGSTIYANSVGSWGLGNYNTADAATIDYDIEQLHVSAQSGGSAITVQGAVNIRYTGNIVSAGTGVHVRINGTFSGAGTLTATGAGNAMYCNSNTNVTWRGLISLREGTVLGVINSSVLRLDRCLVDGTTTRTAGADLLIDGTGAGENTIILTDTTVLGRPGTTVIAAKKVILRGTTVVVGNISATQLVDERPASAAPAVNALGTANTTCICVVSGGSETHPSNQFATVNLSTVVLDQKPAGTTGGFDISTKEYSAPVTGTYQVTTKLRITDNAVGQNQSYGQGVGPVNEDGTWFQWFVGTSGASTNRNGSLNQRLLHLNAGDKIRMYAYFDQFSAAYGAEINIVLLAAG